MALCYSYVVFGWFSANVIYAGGLSPEILGPKAI